jgi:DNA-binding MarR family transcriptional regulator
MVTMPSAVATYKENGRTTERKARLRLWIRLIRTSRFIEGVIRERLKRQFNATLPRFEIARFLIVSNGNITGIVDRLVAEGFVARSRRNGDRRTSFITLTRRGRAAFAAMAAANERWIDELLSGISPRDAEHLSAKLKSFRSDWEGEA